MLWTSGSEKSLVRTKVHSSTPSVYGVHKGERSKALIQPGFRARLRALEALGFKVL